MSEKLKQRLCAVCERDFYTPAVSGRPAVVCSTECRKQRKQKQVRQYLKRRAEKAYTQERQELPPLPEVSE